VKEERMLIRHAVLALLGGIWLGWIVGFLLWF